MSRVAISARVLFGAALALVMACSDGTTGGANSNTNWLLACDTPADCGGAWDCLCGVCTSSCEDACEAEDGVCASEDALAHSLQCGDDTTALCLRGCSGDAECSGDDVCVTGACSPRPEPAGCDEQDGSLFCSSFEHADLAADAETLHDGGELAQSSAEKLSGSGALAATVAGDATRSRARYEYEPQTAGTLYLRAWLYLDLADASAAHVHTITIGSVDTEAYGTDVHIDGGKLGLSFKQLRDVAGTQPVPARSWFCVRVAIALGASDGAASLWLNDELSAEATGADTLPPEGAHDLSIGIDASEQPEVRVLFDDVLLSTEPVSCAD